MPSNTHKKKIDAKVPDQRDEFTYILVLRTVSTNSNDSFHKLSQANIKQLRAKSTPTEIQEKNMILEAAASSHEPLYVHQHHKAMITDELSDVREKYLINPKPIGYGHYGVVRKCLLRGTSEWLAIKSINKFKIGNFEALQREVEILKELDTSFSDIFTKYNNKLLDQILINIILLNFINNFYCPTISLNIIQKY